MPRRTPKKKPGEPAKDWRDHHFDPDDMKYTDGEWLVPSSDANGHSVREWVRMMPAMAGELDLILTHMSKLCGYQTKGDILRHAITRHIEWLHRIEPTMKRTYLGSIQAMLSLLEEDRHKSETEKLFGQLCQRVDHHLQEGDYGEVARIVSDLKRALDNTADTAWRRRWIERYRRQYAHYLMPGPVVEMPKELAPAAPVAVAPDGDEVED